MDASPDLSAVAQSPLGAVTVPYSVVVPEVHIHIVGYGNRLPNDFTLELLATLKRCKRVFGSPAIDARRYGIAEMQDLAGLDTDAAAGQVLAAAAARPPVALAVAGSPLVGSPVAQRIVELAGDRGLATHVAHGVPAFNPLWADLNIEPFYGCEIWDAATFVACDVEPRGRSNLLLTAAPVHDGVVLAVLRERLARRYAPDHELYVAPEQPGIGPHVFGAGGTSVTLGELRPCAHQPRILVVPRIAEERLDFGRRAAVPAAAAAAPPDPGEPVPWELVVPDADIHLVGYGNRLPNDFTLEFVAVLQRCRRVFAVPPLHAPEFGIAAMESLMHLYAPDKPRPQTYEEWVEIVLAAAMADPPVAFATYGSPMVGVQTAHRILELAPARGLTVHVSGAPSSFDGIWADLNLDPCAGVAIWEATVFLRLGIVPDPRADLLLPQAPVLEVRNGLDVERMTIATSSTIEQLRDHLLRFYPPDHDVHLVTTGSGAGAHMLAPRIETLALDELDRPGSNPMSTLLVPRLAPAGSDEPHRRAWPPRRDDRRSFPPAAIAIGRRATSTGSRTRDGGRTSFGSRSPA